MAGGVEGGGGGGEYFPELHRLPRPSNADCTTLIFFAIFIPAGLQLGLAQEAST